MWPDRGSAAARARARAPAGRRSGAKRRARRASAQRHAVTTPPDRPSARSARDRAHRAVAAARLTHSDDPLAALERAVDDAPQRSDARAEAWLALAAATRPSHAPLEAHVPRARRSLKPCPHRRARARRSPDLRLWAARAGRRVRAGAAERSPSGEPRARVLRLLARTSCARAARPRRGGHRRAIDEKPEDWSLYAQLARPGAARDMQAAAERA